jgi:hypothetical protein
MPKTPAWQRKEGQNPEGGLNEKGRASLRAEGRDIKRPVKAGGAKRSPAAAKRRIAFCRRSKGQLEKLTSAETRNDPNSRIRKARRAWDCD